MKSQEEQWLLHEKYNGVKSDAFYADCKALALGEPLGYLIGHIPFLDCTIYLDDKPLIPRVETEFWVEKAIEAVKENQSIQNSLFDNTSTTYSPDSDTPSLPQPNPPSDSRLAARSASSADTTKILDLCAGSGCIGVAVAKAVPEAEVDFSELSNRLVANIEKNCVENNINQERYSIYHSNLFQNIPTGTKYQFILSNPPYIDPAIDRATDSVKSHEPHLALYGGVAGVEIIEQLIKAAPDYLESGGQLWIEHEPEQSVAIQSIARENNFTATSHLDQYQVDRYSILVLQ